MMIALMALYLALLFSLVWLGLIRFNAFWKASPLIVLLLLNILLFIPMGWGAPQGKALVYRNAVSIVPNVSGEVVEVPTIPNKALRHGDVLFRIDATPYDAQVRGIEAQLKLSTTRLSQMTTLFERDAGRAFDVEQRQSEVDQLRAQLEAARWNLDKTTVRAPADGYVTNVALRSGARVGNTSASPVMAFIDTSSTHIAVEIAQIDARYIAPGQEVEIAFKFVPGQSSRARWKASCRRWRRGRPRYPEKPSCRRASPRCRSSPVSRSTTSSLPKRFRPAPPARRPSSPITSRSAT